MASRDAVGRAVYETEVDPSGLKKGLSEAERAIAKVGAASEDAFEKKGAAAVGRFGRSVDGVVGRFNDLSKRGGIGGIMLGGAGVGLGLGAGVGAFGVVMSAVGGVTDAIRDSVDAAKTFDDQLRTINTVAGVSDAQLQRIGDRIQELSRETGKTTDDLTAGFYDLVSAGIPAEHAMQVLKDSAILATGALGTTGEVVDLLTSTLNAYGMEATESTRITDVFAKAVADGKVTAAELGSSIAQIAPIAAAAGVSIEEVAAGYAQLTKNGVPAAQAATQMRSAISALLTPNTQLAKIQRDLNVSFAEMASEDGLAVALQRLREAAGSDEAFAKALGSVEALSFSLLTTGENAGAFATELTAVETAAREGGTALDQYKEKSKSAVEQDKRRAAEVQTLMQDVGDMVMPIYDAMVGASSLVVQTIRDLGEAFHDFERFLSPHTAAIEDTTRALIAKAQALGVDEDALLSYYATTLDAAAASEELDKWVRYAQSALAEMEDDDARNTLIAGLTEELTKLAEAAGVPLGLVLAAASVNMGNFNLAVDGTSSLLAMLSRDFGVATDETGAFMSKTDEAAAIALAFLAKTRPFNRGWQELGGIVGGATDAVATFIAEFGRLSRENPGGGAEWTKFLTDNIDLVREHFDELPPHIQNAMRASGIVARQELGDWGGTIAQVYQARLVNSMQGFWTGAGANALTPSPEVIDIVRGVAERIGRLFGLDLADGVGAGTRTAADIFSDLGPTLRERSNAIRSDVRSVMRAIRLDIVSPFRDLDDAMFIQSRLASKAIQRGLRSSDPEIRKDTRARVAFMERQQDELLTETRLKSLLTSRAMERGLASEDPEIRKKWRARKRFARERLIELRDETKEIGEDTVVKYGEGLDSQDGVTAVTDALSSIAGLVVAFFKLGSPAKKGPLSVAGGPQGWAQQMVEKMAIGARAGLPAFSSAMGDVAAAAAFGGPGITGYSISASATQTVRHEHGGRVEVALSGSTIAAARDQGASWEDVGRMARAADPGASFLSGMSRVLQTNG